MRREKGRIKRYLGYTGLILVLFLTVFFFSRSKQNIKMFVMRNEEQLTAFAEDVLQNGAIGGIEEYKGYPVTKWASDSDGSVLLEFYHHGSGSVPNTSYFGFYYVPDDLPKTFQNAQGELWQSEDGWKWEDDGDNWGYTEKITDHWYYYEAHF